MKSYFELDLGLYFGPKSDTNRIVLNFDLSQWDNYAHIETTEDASQQQQRLVVTATVSRRKI